MRLPPDIKGFMEVPKSCGISIFAEESSIAFKIGRFMDS